jgi:biopolymer transport protein TolQ
MNQDLSIVQLVLHASWLVQLVIAGLLVMSLASWAVIFGKLVGLSRIRSRNDAFEQEFWSGKNLADLHKTASNKAESAPLERLFASGMREFLKLRERQLDPASQLDGARRAMRASLQRELDTLEGNLGFLASVGSVSPYVGLFGTVWGIMHAFVGLSNLQQVTLATVAPGIAEALVATAIQLESFSDEFSNILQRNAGSAAAPLR